MNGETIPTPCSASSRSSVSSRSTTSRGRLVRQQPGDRQRQLAAHVAVRVHHDAAADLGEPRDRERHLVVVHARRTTMLCASWATVVANAPRCRPKPRTKPTPTRPVAWWRSTTAILAMSRAGSAVATPCVDRRQLDAREGQELLGDDLDHAHRPPRRRHAQVGQADRRSVHRLAHPDRHLGARERRDGLAVEDELAVLVDAARVERDEVVEQHEVGAVAGRDRARVDEPVVQRGVQRGEQQRVLGRDALGHGDAAHLVDVALAHEEVGLAVVGAERAALGPELAHERQERLQVARVGGLADQHPGALAALLERLLVGRRLVVRADAGGQVGVEVAPAHARRVAVRVRRAAQRELAQLVRVAGDDGGEVHHLGHAERVAPAQHRLEVADRERAARRLEAARGHARRCHHPDVERHVVADVEQPVDAVRAEHVRDLVRIGDHRGRAVREHRPRELVDHQLRRLDVHVRVDEARHEVAPACVHPLAAGVAAEARDAPVGDRHVDVEPLLGEGREHLGVLDHEIGRDVTARDIDQTATADSLEHAQRPSLKTMSSGLTGTRTSSTPVAARTAATMAGVEEIVGGSPTPLAP